MLDFGMLPPEINSGRIYVGAGAEPLLAASTAWDVLATELVSAADSYRSTVAGLLGVWMGPSSAAMAAAGTMYAAWLTTTAAQAERTANQARTAAATFEAAFAATVPPPVVATNRLQLAVLVSTNILGQNTAAIAANEALYAEMWAQDAAAMNAYAAGSQAATAALPAFTPAPQTTNPTSSVTQAVAAATGGWLDNSTTSGQLIQAVLSSGFPVDVAQLFGNFIGYSMIAGATQAANNIYVPPAQMPAPPIVNIPAPAAPTPAVAASTGTGSSVGQLSVPPSWARPPEQKPPQITVDTPTRDRYQAAIPAVPFMPVTGLKGGTKQQRPEPEYGSVPRVMPSTPYGG